MMGIDDVDVILALDVIVLLASAVIGDGSAQREHSFVATRQRETEKTPASV